MKWTTTRTEGFRGGIWPTDDGGQNPAAYGGVRHTQVAKRAGKYYRRHVNTNGRHAEHGIPELLTDPADIEAARSAIER